MALFASPTRIFLDSVPPLRALALARSVGLLVIVMAVTDTGHPPTAGTVAVMATRTWVPRITVIIVGAVLLLAVVKRLLQRHLRDLI